jgi:hypothetical protein
MTGPASSSSSSSSWRRQQAVSMWADAAGVPAGACRVASAAAAAEQYCMAVVAGWPTSTAALA